MNKSLIFLTTLFISFFNLHAKNTFDSIPSYELLQKLIKKGTFEDGQIYTATDTQSVKILKFKGAYKTNNFKYCITVNDSGTTRAYSAFELLGYKVKDEVFRKHFADKHSFFIKKTITGKACLYEKEKLTGEDSFLYYIQLPGYDQFFVINPFGGNIENQANDENLQYSVDKNKTYIKAVTNNIPQKFKLFIEAYFYECKQVVNMVKNEFYTINDIPSIIRTYNSCSQ